MAKYNEHGEQIPDPTPVEVPLRYQNSFDPMEDLITREIHRQLQPYIDEAGAEEFGEFNDFEIADDDEMVPSEHEMFAEDLEDVHSAFQHTTEVQQTDAQPEKPSEESQVPNPDESPERPTQED